MINYNNNKMKRITFLTVAAVLITLVAAYGQQSAKYSDINAIARVLAKEIPEINAKYDVQLSAAHTCPKEWSEEQKKNYLSYYTEQKDEHGFKESVKKIQMYRYERPHLATDLVVVIYTEDYHDYDAVWYACDRKTGALTKREMPLNNFDKKAYNLFGGWRKECDIRPDGNIKIEVAPSMQETNNALICWDKTKEKFTFKFTSRGGDYGCGDGDETEKDNAEMEQYVQKVIRPNFQRINAVKNWVLVQKIDLSDYVGDDDLLSNAELTCHHSEEGLEKAVVKIPKKAMYEYYFLNKSLSFVYYAAYDKAGAVATERRWYLKNGCFRGIGDKGKKLTPAQIKEEFYDEDTSYIEVYGYIFRAMDDQNN